MDFLNAATLYVQQQPNLKSLWFIVDSLPDETLCYQILTRYPALTQHWLIINHREALQPQNHAFVQRLCTNTPTIYPLNATILWHHHHPKHAFIPYAENAAVIDARPATKTRPQIHQQLDEKPWLRPPARQDLDGVAIIGAGIAGISTAFYLAEHGIDVDIFEAKTAGHAASGNRQGLLFAKLSAHQTLQSQLLNMAYAYTQATIEQLPKNQVEYDLCGLLQLAHSPQEQQRQDALAHHTSPFFHQLDAQAASTIAGMPLTMPALYWPRAGWIAPRSWLAFMLRHPRIHLHEHCPITTFRRHGEYWQLFSQQKSCFLGSHLVFASGAERHFDAVLGLHLATIGGQTDVWRADATSQSLRCALSANSYIAPCNADGSHTIGATFHPNQSHTQYSHSDQIHNSQRLLQDFPALQSTISSNHYLSSHMANRSDAYDHLPIVGAVGDATAMRQCYAHLAKDKSWHYDNTCPYLPGVYFNSAHGSRGLLTAPFAAMVLAEEMLEGHLVLPAALRHALLPNRLIIRDIVKNTPR